MAGRVAGASSGTGCLARHREVALAEAVSPCLLATVVFAGLLAIVHLYSITCLKWDAIQVFRRGDVLPGLALLSVSRMLAWMLLVYIGLDGGRVWLRRAFRRSFDVTVRVVALLLMVQVLWYLGALEETLVWMEGQL